MNRFLTLTALCLTLSLTGCFLGANANDNDDTICQGRHNVYIEASKQACDAAGPDVAEWIDGGGCYCY